MVPLALSSRRNHAESLQGADEQGVEIVADYRHLGPVLATLQGSVLQDAAPPGSIEAAEGLNLRL